MGIRKGAGLGWSGRDYVSTDPAPFSRSPAPGPAPSVPVPRPQRLRFCVGPEMGPEVQRARRHLDR